MSISKLTAAGPNGQRRNTIVNLKQVAEVPLRNALETFDKNGDGKIDLVDLQRVMYWYGMWKYASIGLCFAILALMWSTFGLTIWAINLTKDYTVTNGVLTGGEEVVKMSVASTYIPLSWATLLDRRHLDSLDSLTIEVAQSSGKFSAGVYHVKVASYLHANSTYLKLFGKDGSRVWINSGTVVLHHPHADEAIMVCGAAACNTFAVDVKPEYLEQLVQRSAALFESARDFELPSTVDGVAINKADGKGVTCMAMPCAWWDRACQKDYIQSFKSWATASLNENLQDLEKSENGYLSERINRYDGPAKWNFLEKKRAMKKVEQIGDWDVNANEGGKALKNEKYPAWAQVSTANEPPKSVGYTKILSAVKNKGEYSPVYVDPAVGYLAAGGFSNLKSGGVQSGSLFYGPANGQPAQHLIPVVPGTPQGLNQNWDAGFPNAY